MFRTKIGVERYLKNVLMFLHAPYVKYLYNLVSSFQKTINHPAIEYEFLSVKFPILVLSHHLPDAFLLRDSMRLFPSLRISIG